MTDDYRDWDAAYLLGSLSPAERREFEEHLVGCADCSAAVAELAALPGLLAKVPAGELEPAEQVPESVLPRLVAAVRRRRMRVRTLTTGLVMAAAAVAVAVTLVVPQLIPAAPGERVAELTLSQVVPSSLSAQVRLVGHEWGTSVDMNCQYTAGGQYGGTSSTYALYVTDSGGHETQLATWTARPGRTVEPSGTTSIALADIRSVDVRSVASGTILLSGSP
jgi:anti-sigma factor RsiW